MSTLTSLVISKKRKIIDNRTKHIRQLVAQQARLDDRVGTSEQASFNRDNSPAESGQAETQRIDDERGHA